MFCGPTAALSSGWSLELDTAVLSADRLPPESSITRPDGPQRGPLFQLRVGDNMRMAQQLKV